MLVNRLYIFTFLFFSLTLLGAKPAEVNVVSYQIYLKIMPDKQEIEGSNTIGFLIQKEGKTLQLKLAPQLSIRQISLGSKNLTYTRDTLQLLIDLPDGLSKNDTHFVKVSYGGVPKVAKKAPWDGGFVWSVDSLGKPWIGMACEGIGASSWLPSKDTWDDEPEHVVTSLEVPKGLTGVSNGRLVQTAFGIETDTYTWETKNPINHYNIAINVGAYALFKDQFIGVSNDTLSLDYYVLSYNLSAAKTHFQQCKRMLGVFESCFGKYPFYEDGYKLVETPYWGMEHQSCVAYGNNYENNSFGFDFIIIHESGHEWFANNITAADKADMWVHESFTTYSEALYVERIFGKARALDYLMMQKDKIKNESPMIGVYGTNHKFDDNDIYYKGTWLLHTLRSMVDNDTLWFNTLRDLNKHFYHQTISSKQLEAYLSKRLRMNLQPFFNQYLRKPELPVFEYYLVDKDGLNELHYRLRASSTTLEMPVRVTLSKNKFDFLYAGVKWKIIDVPFNDVSDFKVDTKHFLIGQEKIEPKK